MYKLWCWKSSVGKIGQLSMKSSNYEMAVKITKHQGLLSDIKLVVRSRLAILGTIAQSDHEWIRLDVRLMHNSCLILQDPCWFRIAMLKK